MALTNENHPLRSLLQQLHEESDRQTYARAREQFQGDDDAFQELATAYFDLAPHKKPAFLKAHGLATNDSGDTGDARLSLAISPQTGAFIKNVALAKGPSSILELGSSNGASTIYFAEALSILGKGRVVATERDREKCESLRRNLRTVGLEKYVCLLEGDVFETIDSLSGTFDIVFFDIWASDYLRALEKIEPLISTGTVILADNMYTAEDDVRPFKEYLTANPRISATTLDFESGLEFAVVGAAPKPS